MAAPSAPIDADLSLFSNDVYYVLEEGGIWKTTNLTTAGAATWTQVWSDSDFEGESFGGLMRIKCAPNQDGLVYVLGWGEETSGTYKPFVLRSQNAGATWSQHWIDEEVEQRDYTVTFRSTTQSYASGGPAFKDYLVHGRVGDDVAGDYNPWAMAAYCTELTSTGHYWPGTLADTDTLNNFTDSTYSANQIEGGVNTLLDAPDEATADDWMDDYFGVGGWNKTSDGDMPKADGRTKYGSNERHTTGDYPRTIHVDSWVFWNKPSPNMPKAFDVARTNANWLYVGLEDKIMKSENGGNDWTELTDDHGAYDICVDPQLAGAIYYWDTSGELRLRVAGVDQGSLLSDSALDQHGRIARDLNSGKLWVIDAYGDVQMREAGSWTTKKSGVSVGHSLRAYLGGKLIFMDAEDIYLSTDYGENWSNKKGGWSYADPVSVHLMKDET